MTERFMACDKCGGHLDTLVKVGDGKYRHQSEASCLTERKRQKDKAVSPKPEILAARRILVPSSQSSKLVLPGR